MPAPDVRPLTDDDPDPRLLWQWVAQAARPWLGWILIAAAALLMLLGYFGVSREALPAKHAYFVHSYYFDVRNTPDVLARTEYGGPITAVVGRDNMVGTQFHPEKSQKLGLALIANFLRWQP